MTLLYKSTTLALLLIVITLLGCEPSSLDTNQGGKRVETVSATLIPNPRPLIAFTLKDHLGNKFSLDSLKGSWSLLSFGYTHCPDVCPTTLTLLAQLNKKLSQENNLISYNTLFVSIDPSRDTTEALKQYMNAFNPSFLGVTGEETEINKLTNQLGILHEKGGSEPTASTYTVDHSNALILIDPAARFHAVFSTPHKLDRLAKDLSLLLQK